MNASNNESKKSETKEISNVAEIAKSPVIQVQTTDISKHEHDYFSSEWCLVYITLFLAIITGALAFYTARLWKATKTMVNSADATAQRQLRAYVGILNSEIINLGTNKPIKTHVTIKNSGQTPAYALTGFSGVGLAESFDTLNTTTIPTDKSFGVLNPNGDFIITSNVQPMSDSQYDDLSKGIKTLFVYGEYHYIDAFDKPCVLKYRVMTGGPVGINGTMLASCQEGNEAT